MKTINQMLLAAIACLSMNQTLANPSNLPPPLGALLDLNGQVIPTSYQLYSVNFVASLSGTDITFAIRNDPSYTILSDLSVIDLTAASPNLLVNGTFAGANGSSAVAGWTYDNLYGAIAGGFANPGCGFSVGTGCWQDGTVQAYDAFDQMIGTHIGDLYQISFELHAGGAHMFSDLSTNGDTTDVKGNGNDVLVYAQAGLPPDGEVPEPASIWLVGLGLICLGRLRRGWPSVR